MKIPQVRDCAISVLIFCINIKLATTSMLILQDAVLTRLDVSFLEEHACMGAVEN